MLSLVAALLPAAPLALANPARDATADAERTAQALRAAPRLDGGATWDSQKPWEGVVILRLRSGRGYPGVTFDVATTVGWALTRAE